jgi:alpha,alpha-trehalase
MKTNYQPVLNYIEKYWKSVTCYQPKDKQTYLGMPNKYISPNDNIFKNDQFYWDSYFTILGLVKSDRVDLAKGMVDNLTYLFKRFGIVPMRNRYFNLGTSQIPFLTSMAFEVFETTQDRQWLRRTIKIAEAELRNYWLNDKLTERHNVQKGLCRYCDHYITHLGAEHESGWDMTSRFNDRCLDYLPVDLNSCLYKYESDISRVYYLLKDFTKAKSFGIQAEKRKIQITELMWNKKRSFFFDYNKLKAQQSRFYSVAGFYPLWAGLATRKQADAIRSKVLELFEHEHGVTNTLPHFLSKDLKQHDFPNGWPQQQWIVIKGLLNYGFTSDAKRLAGKWLNLNTELFKQTGKLWEKYDVLNGRTGVYNPDRYPTQSGFSWTNAVFIKLVSEFNLQQK